MYSPGSHRRLGTKASICTPVRSTSATLANSAMSFRHGDLTPTGTLSPRFLDARRWYRLGTGSLCSASLGVCTLATSAPSAHALAPSTSRYSENDRACLRSRPRHHQSQGGALRRPVASASDRFGSCPVHTAWCSRGV